MSFMEEFFSKLVFTEPILYICILNIFLNPTYWNTTSYIEYNTKKFSKFWGSPKVAVIVHGLIIFSLGVIRNLIFSHICTTFPQFSYVPQWIICLAYLTYAIGIILVSTSTYKLGIVGTYNGDAYGFPLSEKIEGFPFNVTVCPMYDGSSLNFLSHAIINKSPMGLLLAVLVFAVYRISNTFFEDPFTIQFYKDLEKKKGKKAN